MMMEAERWLLVKERISWNKGGGGGIVCVNEGGREEIEPRREGGRRGPCQL